MVRNQFKMVDKDPLEIKLKSRIHKTKIVVPKLKKHDVVDKVDWD